MALNTKRAFRSYLHSNYRIRLQPLALIRLSTEKIMNCGNGMEISIQIHEYWMAGARLPDKAATCAAGPGSEP
jgi:hypothetical protein